MNICPSPALHVCSFIEHLTGIFEGLPSVRNCSRSPGYSNKQGRLGLYPHGSYFLIQYQEKDVSMNIDGQIMGAL